MTVKCSWLWNGSAADGRISFGFSENWYSNDSPAVLLPKMQENALIRVNNIASGTFLYGYRVMDLAANSRAFTHQPSQNIAGPGRNNFPNVPQDAVLCQVFGTAAGTVKRFWFHCLPDNRVFNGEVNQATVTCARETINNMAANGFMFRYVDQNAGKYKIQTIDAAGNVTLLEASAGLAVGSVVQLYHVRGVDGRGKRGRFAIDTYTDATHFKLSNYAGGAVNLSGSIRKINYLFTPLVPVPNLGFGSDPTIRPGIRKCGRPFGQLRGRAVARR